MTIGANRRAAIVAGLMGILIALAACRSAATQAGTPSAAPTATVSPSATPPAWILVSAAAERRALAAVRNSAGGSKVTVGPPGEQPETLPAGLVAVVSTEDELESRYEAWARAGAAFVVLDGTSIVASDRTSVIEVWVRYDQAGFLAGLAAGLATIQGGVGLTPQEATEGKAFAAGLDQGLRYVCPKCRLESVPDPGRVPFGVDVVVLSPGPALPMVEPAAGAPWLVVLGGGSPAGWRDRVAARIRVSEEVLIEEALRRLLQGAAGETWSISVETGGLRLEDIHAEAISPGRERLLREAEARLASSMLAVGGEE